MPLRCIIVAVLLFSSYVLPAQQYYFKGKFADTAGNAIAYVNLKAKNAVLKYQAGRSGEFGIPSFNKSDSVTCFLEGYDSVVVYLHNDAYNVIVMRLSEKKLKEQQRNASLSSSPHTLPADKDVEEYGISQGEEYNNLTFNNWVEASKNNSTSLAPNSNRASYSNIRRFISQRTRVPANAVRLDEIWNYFQPKLEGLRPLNDRFNMASAIGRAPWDTSHYLVMLNAIAPKLNMENLPPANLVFLIDNSGSMDASNRLPLLKAGFTMLVNNMRPKDKIAIVTYGGVAGIALAPTFVEHKERIIEVINGLEAGGATPGSQGIQLAYQLATTNPVSDGINRVILATDGDFNVGLVEEKDLEVLIKQYQYTGVTLSCLGVGMGNYKDSKIETLARWGRGNFAYLDSEEEAQKVLVEEFTQNLYASATGVLLNFKTDPSLVKQYRLLGFDNKTDALLQKTATVTGTTAGSVQSVIAMVEIEPVKEFKAGDVPVHWNIAYQLSNNSQQSSLRTDANKCQYNGNSEPDAAFEEAAALAWYALNLRDAALGKTVSFKQLQLSKNQQASAALYKGFQKLLNETIDLYEPKKDPRQSENQKLRIKEKKRKS